MLYFCHKAENECVSVATEETSLSVCLYTDSRQINDYLVKIDLLLLRLFQIILFDKLSKKRVCMDFKW